MASRGHGRNSRSIDIFSVLNERGLIKDEPINSLIFNYLRSFLSSYSYNFLYVWRTFSSSLRSSALLGGLYLFTSYALRCFQAFRNLRNYLGIAIFASHDGNLGFSDFAEFSKATYAASRQSRLPTPRDASGPDERATTLHPFLSTNSFELQTSKITFLFDGGANGSFAFLMNSSPHIHSGNWSKKSLILNNICCARSRVFPIARTVCGDFLSARHISQDMKAPAVVVIPACLGLVVTTLFALPSVLHKSCCLGNSINGTIAALVLSKVLR